MIKGKYPAEFRISEFKAYPNPDIQSETHKTNLTASWTIRPEYRSRQVKT